MRALLIAALLLFPAAPAIASTYYVDSAASDDSANGTTPVTPWKHAPGMTSAGGNALLTNLVGDDIVCMKLGVTWNRTNGSIPWTWDFKGTAGHLITVKGCAGYGTGSYWDFDGELTLGSSMFYVPGDVTNGYYTTIKNIDAHGLNANTRDYQAIFSINCAKYFVIDSSQIHDWDYVYASDINGPQTDLSLPRDGNHGGIIGAYNGIYDTPGSCGAVGSYITNTEVSNIEGNLRGRQNGVGVWDFDVFDGSIVHDVVTSTDKGQIHNMEMYNVMWPSLGCSVVGSNQSFASCDTGIANGQNEGWHDDASYIYGTNGHSNGVSYTYGVKAHDIAVSAGTIFLNETGTFYVFNNLIYNIKYKNAIAVDPYNTSSGGMNIYVWNNTLHVEETMTPPIRMVPRTGITIGIFQDINNHHIFHGQFQCDCNTTYDPMLYTASTNLTQGDSSGAFYALASASGYDAAHEFQPQSGAAPSVDAGTNLTSSGIAHINEGIEGNTRPPTGSVDIGAYQFTPYVIPNSSQFPLFRVH